MINHSSMGFVFLKQNSQWEQANYWINLEYVSTLWYNLKGRPRIQRDQSKKQKKNFLILQKKMIQVFTCQYWFLLIDNIF